MIYALILDGCYVVDAYTDEPADGLSWSSIHRGSGIGNTVDDVVTDAKEVRDMMQATSYCLIDVDACKYIQADKPPWVVAAIDITQIRKSVQAMRDRVATC